MEERTDVFSIPEDMIPEQPIGDTIISTTSLTKTLNEGINRTIRNVMTGIESNYNTNSGDKRFKLVRKIVLDNLNDYKRDIISNIVSPIFQYANDSIISLQTVINALQKENSELKEKLNGSK